MHINNVVSHMALANIACLNLDKVRMHSESISTALDILDYRFLENQFLTNICVWCNVERELTITMSRGVNLTITADKHINLYVSTIYERMVS